MYATDKSSRESSADSSHNSRPIRSRSSCSDKEARGEGGLFLEIFSVRIIMADYIEKKLRDEEKVGKAWGKETERGRRSRSRKHR